MHVLILGGGGFLGSRLARELLHPGGTEPVAPDRLTLVDLTFPEELTREPRLQCMEADFSDRSSLRKCLGERPDLIFHLAAVVSGEAEKDLEKGMRVNFHASLQLLEICREMSHLPRIVFASSCAVFGGDLPHPVRDDAAARPRSSYGSEKAMVELLMNDYSRKGFVDARSLRLPTITVRPGKPNAATSSFVSSIIREPLNGIRVSCPVPPDTALWIQSPESVVRNFIHAANLDERLLGEDRIINLPGLTVTVRQLMESLEKLAGPEVTRLIAFEPDPFIQGIVLTWPSSFNAVRAKQLGFVNDASAEEIVRNYMVAEKLI